jgi:hypothetical protein
MGTSTSEQPRLRTHIDIFIVLYEFCAVATPEHSRPLLPRKYIRSLTSLGRRSIPCDQKHERLPDTPTHDRLRKHSNPELQDRPPENT